MPAILSAASAAKPVKVDIYVVSTDPEFRGDVAKCVHSFYRVLPFDDAAQAASQMADRPPAAVVLDENARPFNGVTALREIERHKGLEHVPLICIASADQADLIRQVNRHEPHVLLLKPYSTGELLAALSREVNQGVEAQWKTLKPVQQQALIGTVSQFHKLTDLIETGSPLPYGEVKESCQPLVDAVRENEYQGILAAVRSHDNYSYVHSLRVATFLALFGHTIGMRGDELLTLSVGGLVHDAGKQAIPFDVLNKPGRLSSEEWTVMRSHVDRTVTFLDLNPDIPKGVRTIAAQHHEKLDGTGYPLGLKGAELNELARMACIVDIFGALTDRRVYKPAMPPEDALALMAGMSDAVDQHLLQLFRAMLMDAAGRLDAA